MNKMKQVIKSDLGTVQIHKEVVAEIVNAAISSVDGVRAVDSGIREKLFAIFGKKVYPGVQIKITDNNVNLQIKVLAKYGTKIPDVGKKLQEAVKEAIDKALEVNLKGVNVNICGIERG